MNQPQPPGDVPAISPEEAAASVNDLESIRALLFGEEKRELDSLKERLENPGIHAHDVSEVLPQAVTLASAKDGKLAWALTPAVESALKESVKRNPAPLVAAIFPIIGPAIRKSIAEMFSKLVLSLNQTLDHSFSLQGLKWRLEAARTGKSFAEVVLANTLVYRVEQVFLIHKQTSLLLQHLTAPQIRAEDASMVSGMLGAIQDFARDSFRVSAGESLHTLQIGELNVWVEGSPSATLAAVIRGQAPHDFRTVLQHALEDVHREHQSALESFDGDAAQFDLVRPQLELCLQAQFSERAKKKSPAKLVAMVAVPVVLIAVWLGFVVRDQRRWADYLDRLKAEPGIVVTETGKRSGKFFVTGLRDPLAADPASLLSDFKLEHDAVAGRWEPYQALSPELILKRAEKLLHPPAGVTLKARDGVLIARGQAPGSWIEHARVKALLVPGIHTFDDRGLAGDAQALRWARQRTIEQTVVLFEDGLRLASEQETTIDRLAPQLNEIRQAVLGSGRRSNVLIVGHSGKVGVEKQSLDLSHQRAEHIASLLIARGVPADFLAPTAFGLMDPAPAGAPDGDAAVSRHVSFRVLVEEAVAP